VNCCRRGPLQPAVTILSGRGCFVWQHAQIELDVRMYLLATNGAAMTAKCSSCFVDLGCYSSVRQLFTLCFLAVKHNNVIPNAHFRKEWQERVKTWLDQPLRKARRRAARAAKAVAIAPRPASGSLRPVVRGQTVRYNIRVRAGRGFSLEELKAAGVNANTAATLGVAVDHRRRNKSTASLNENAARLKTYLSKLTIFPRKSGAKHLKKGDATAAERKAATQFSGEILPIRQPAPTTTFVKIADVKTTGRAYATLRKARSDAKLVGRRAKRAAEAAAEKKPAADAAAE
jgi:large subunit ribosomal protein L13e